MAMNSGNIADFPAGAERQAELGRRLDAIAHYVSHGTPHLSEEEVRERAVQLELCDVMLDLGVIHEGDR